jgi:hypothetical protein
MPGEETVGMGLREDFCRVRRDYLNSDPANAVPVLIAIDEFNILRATPRKQTVAVARGTCAYGKESAAGSSGRG